MAFTEVTYMYVYVYIYIYMFVSLIIYIYAYTYGTVNLKPAVEHAGRYLPLERALSRLVRPVCLYCLCALTLPHDACEVNDRRLDGRQSNAGCRSFSK